MPRRRSVGLGALISLFGLLLVLSGTASAARVVVLAGGGHSWSAEDPYVTGPALTPAPVATPAAGGPLARTAGGSVHNALNLLAHRHAISAATARRYSRDLDAATASLRRLHGSRATELGSVLANLQSMTRRGHLTASRLPPLFLTLARNRSWWTTGPLLSDGQRVEFAGSQLVWEYYAGQGIELQELGSFGKANGLFSAGRRSYHQMIQLLSELIPLASHRAGGIAWEYFFQFDGGLPPWTSAMSQSTALVSLSRAYQVTHHRSYLKLGQRALGLFATSPPTGARVRTSRGARYVQYTFAPGASILNAFLQSLIGLYDFSHVSGDHRAARMFALGDAEARAEVPHFDTGSWSLYQPGVLDTVDYHVLVTGFLHELCRRTHAHVYCATAARFDEYLKHHH